MLNNRLVEIVSFFEITWQKVGGTREATDGNITAHAPYALDN
jgi:hypothetical protein